MPVDGPLYPVNLRLAGKRCLLVGGGAVAVQKARELLACDAVLTVVAPTVAAELADDPRVTVHRRPYEPADLDGCRLAFTATDDPATNAAVARDAEAREIWVNSADDPANCTFTLPSRVRQGHLLVTFATGGHSPAVATWLRRRFTDEFGPEYARLIDVLAEAREEVRAQGRSTEGLDWQSALDSGMLELIRLGRVPEAKELLRRCLAQ